MPSIHKDPRGRSPYWLCFYTRADGRRTSISTKQTDRKKAWAFCLALSRANDTARAGELTEFQARRALRQILEDTGSSLDSDSVREFASGWLAGKALSVTPKTLLRYRAVLESFLESLGPRADKSVANVTPRDCVAFRDSCLSRGITTSTLWQSLKVIRGLFENALEQGLVMFNPARGVKAPRIRSLQHEVFTPTEISALVASASPEWKTLVLLGAFTGGRLVDLARLTWTSIDFAAGLLSFRQGKTDTRVVVPLHSELTEHLASIARNQYGALCPSLSRTPGAGRDGLSNQFAKLMEKAGIDQHKVKAGRNSIAQKSFHSFRHTFASMLANAGIASELRMKLTGHKSATIHAIYSHLEMASLKAAIATLPRIS